MTTYERWGLAYRSSAHEWGALHKAVEMRLEDEPRAKIAEATGIPRATQFLLFRALGILKPRSSAQQAHRSRANAIDYAKIEPEVVRLYCDEGLTGPEIETIHGVSSVCVYRMVRRAGRKVRTSGEARRRTNADRARRGLPAIGGS